MPSAQPAHLSLARQNSADARLGRRRFLTMSGVSAVATGLGLLSHETAAAADVSTTPSTVISGTDLNGWTTVLGDGLYTVAGQTPVNSGDIATAHAGVSSTLRANVLRRGVMAHNITYKRQTDTTLFDSVHAVQYSFRLPYMPATSAWPDNAQTVEGGFFIWDGAATRLDYGQAFQWILNPWMPTFGTIRIWNGSSWMSAGFLPVDTNWHTVTMTFDRRNSAAGLAIDGVAIPTALTLTPKSSSWGTEVAARLQAEIISLWPGSNPSAPSHRLEVRDWTWSRHPYLSAN